MVLPTTGRAKLNKFHLPLEIQSVNKETKEMVSGTVYVKMTQACIISNKRLIQKIDVIKEGGRIFKYTKNI